MSLAPILISLSVGVLLGFALALMLRLIQSKSVRDLAEAQRQAEARAITAETTVNELRNQVQEKDSRLTQLAEALQNEQGTRVRAETQLQETQKNLEEQKRLLQEATEQLKDAFNSLAAEALRNNSQSFLDRATDILEKYVTDIKGDLGKRQEAIDHMLKPLKDTLQQYETNLRQVEVAREGAYAELKFYLGELKGTQERLHKETTSLVTALKTSQVRGKYGEIGLRRIVEFAGMSEFCDFEEQVSKETEEGRLRPDLIVKLPGEKRLIVDAKVPLLAYMKAFETTDEAEKKRLLEQHAKAVREHLRGLSSKAYWSQFKDSPDYVVLYLQIESSFGAALELDRTLIEDGIKNRVIFATPTTLITLLRTVAYSWHQEKVAENSKKIWETGVELFNRIVVLLDHINGIGSGLRKAVDSYNNAVGSLESRFIPQARRLKELGAAQSDKDLPETKPIVETTRPLPQATEPVES